MLMLVNYHHEICGSPHGDIEQNHHGIFHRRLHGLVAEVHELPGTSGGPNSPAGKMDKICG